MKKIWLLLLVFQCFVLHGQDIAYTVRISDQSVEQNTSFKVEYIINASATNFEAPRFSGLKVISGPSVMNQSSYINGKVTASTSHTYILMGKKIGKFKIPRASIQVNGKTYYSDEKEVTITERTAKEQASDEDIFIRLELSDTIAYVGQQIIATYKVYTLYDIGGVQSNDIADFEDFYSIDLKSMSSGYREEIINGKRYYSTPVKSIALFAQKDGIYTFDESVFTLNVYKNGKRGFFARPTDRVSIMAPDARLEVRPLPKNAPKSFSGAVGKFSMNTTHSTTNISTDAAFTMKINIAGNGDLKKIEAPEFDLPKGMELYPVKTVDEQMQKGTNDIISNKSFEYSIVPNAAGAFTIIPEFSYFDTDSLAYVTLKDDPININVAQGQNANIAIEDFGNTKQQETPDQSNAWLWYGLGGVLLLGGLALFFSKNKQKDANPTIAKKDPKQIAIRQLAKAKELLTNNDHDAYHTEISNALNRYLTEKYGIENMDRSIPYVEKKLRNENVDHDIISTCTEIMKKCEMALYAKQSSKDMDRLYSMTQDIIERMASQ